MNQKSSQIHTELSVLALRINEGIVVLEYKTRGQNKTRFEAKLPREIFYKRTPQFSLKFVFFLLSSNVAKGGWKIEY